MKGHLEEKEPLTTYVIKGSFNFIGILFNHINYVSMD